MATLNFPSEYPAGFGAMCANHSSLPVVRKWLNAQKYALVTVDARQIIDERTLLSTLGDAFFQLKVEGVPDGSKWVGWDGAIDYAWQGLVGQKRHHVALLFLNTDALLQEKFPILLQAIELMYDVGEASVTHKPHPVRLLTVLLGDGPQFPRLE